MSLQKWYYLMSLKAILLIPSMSNPSKISALVTFPIFARTIEGDSLHHALQAAALIQIITQTSTIRPIPSSCLT